MLPHQQDDTYVPVQLTTGRAITMRSPRELLTFLRALPAGTSVTVLHIRKNEMVGNYFPTEIFNTYPREG